MTMDEHNIDRVYLLMKQDHRVSRNTRARWYFRHLDEDIKLSCDLNDQNSSGNDPDVEVVGLSPYHGPNVVHKLRPSTVVRFLAKRYRLVFTLDLSPSVGALDLRQGHVIIDGIRDTLVNCLRDVTKPIQLSHDPSRMVITPEIYVTILACTPFLRPAANKCVIAQAFLLSHDNVEDLINIVKRELASLLEAISCYSADAISYMSYIRNCAESLIGGLFTNVSMPPPHHCSSRDDGASQSSNMIKSTTSEDNDKDVHIQRPIVLTAVTAFLNMIRQAILAIQLLPENTAAGIIVITDGVTSAPDSETVNLVLSQMRCSTVMCSFIQARHAEYPDCAFGHVPYSELLQFLATGTFGSYLLVDCSEDSSKNVVVTAEEVSATFDKEGSMSIFQQAMLCWSFQSALYDSQRMITPAWMKDCQAIPVKHRLCVSNPRENTLKISHAQLLSCHLREGYTIRSIRYENNNKEIVTDLVLPLHCLASLEYRIRSSRPIEQSTECSVVVNLIAPVFLLRDLKNAVEPNGSYQRRKLTGQLLKSFDALKLADNQLVHLHKFNLDPVLFTVPECFKPESGKNAVFHSPPPHDIIVLSQKLANADWEKFCAYWKSVCLLDIGEWQKWLHTHRITVLLCPDWPLSKNLLHPKSASGGRFATARCHKAEDLVHNLLHEHASFTLLEKHSYVVFVNREGVDVPSFFYLIHVALKPPCMVIRLAFLGGTRGEERVKIVNDLKTRLAKLTLSQKPTSLRLLLPKGSGVLRRSSTILPSENLKSIEQSACVQFKKSLEKFMIRHQSVPEDVWSFLPLTSTSTIDQEVLSGGYSLLNQYLLRRRFLWSLRRQCTFLNSSVSDQAAAFILHCLLRRRLSDGFCLSMSGIGIVTLAKEFELEQLKPDGSKFRHPCVAQYVIMPVIPSNSVPLKSTADGGYREISESEVGIHPSGFIEADCPEDEAVVQLVTELWIEPQYGRTSADHPAESSGMRVADLFHQYAIWDQDIIFSLVTAEHLSVTCLEYPLKSDHTCPEIKLEGDQNRPPPNSPLPDTGVLYSPQIRNKEGIEFWGNCFHLPTLLHRAELSVLLFSTFIHKPNTSKENKSNELPSLYCFVRSSENSYLVVTFCLCSFHDLLTLLQTDLDDNVERTLAFPVFVFCVRPMNVALQLINGSASVLNPNPGLIIEDFRRDPCGVIPQLHKQVSMVSSSSLDTISDDLSSTRHTTSVVSEDLPVFDGSGIKVAERAGMYFNPKEGFLGTDGGDTSYADPSCQLAEHTRLVEEDVSKAMVYAAYYVMVSSHQNPLETGLMESDARRIVEENCMEKNIDINIRHLFNATCRHLMQESITWLENTSCWDELHLDIQERFNQVLGRHFKPVVSCDDLFFMMPRLGHEGNSIISNSDIDTSDANDNIIFGEADAEKSFSSATDFDRELSCHWRTRPSKLSKSPKFLDEYSEESVDDEPCRNELGSSESESDSLSPESRLMGTSPLFLQLYCTIGFEGAWNRSCPIKNIPTCLRQLISEVGDYNTCPLSNDELSSVKVNLDFIALMPSVFTSTEGDQSDTSTTEDELSDTLNDHDELHTEQDTVILNTVHKRKTDIKTTRANVLGQLSSGLPLHDDNLMEDHLLSDDLESVESDDQNHFNPDDFKPLSPEQGHVFWEIKKRIKLIIKDEVIFSKRELSSSASRLKSVCKHISKRPDELPMLGTFTKKQEIKMKLLMNEDVCTNLIRQELANCSHMMEEGYCIEQFNNGSNYFYVLQLDTDNMRTSKRNVSACSNDQRSKSNRSSVERVSTSRQASRSSDVERSRTSSIDERQEVSVNIYDNDNNSEDNCNNYIHVHQSEAGYEGESDDVQEPLPGLTHESFRFPVRRKRKKRSIASEGKSPPFWLILHLESHECCRMYLQFRSNRPGAIGDTKYQHHMKLVEKAVKAAVKKANQTVLLEDLYEKKSCRNDMLIPDIIRLNTYDRQHLTHGADAKRHGKTDGKLAGSIDNMTADSEYDSDEAKEDDGVLYVTERLGKYRCPCVFIKLFKVHARLKSSSVNQHMHPIKQVILSVFDKLKMKVKNRNNQFFVFRSLDKQNKTKAIHYLEIHEVMNVEDEKKLKRKFVDKMVNSVSLPHLESTEEVSASQKGIPNIWYIALTVHGVEPVDHQLVGLFDSLEAKLRDEVLTILVEARRRNRKGKLSRDDIEFIQPPKSEPTVRYKFMLPAIAEEHLLAARYYINQNLLIEMSRPAYVNNKNENECFKPFAKTGDQVADKDSYDFFIDSLFAHEAGTITQKWIMCLSMRFVCLSGKSVKPLKHNVPLVPNSRFFNGDNIDFARMITPQIVEGSRGARKGPSSLLFVEFDAWIMGKLDLSVLNNFLHSTLCKSMCDFVTEFCLLPHAFSDVTSDGPGGVTSEPVSPSVSHDRNSREKFSMHKRHSIDKLPQYSFHTTDDHSTAPTSPANGSRSDSSSSIAPFQIPGSTSHMNKIGISTAIINHHHKVRMNALFVDKSCEWFRFALGIESTFWSNLMKLGWAESKGLTVPKDTTTTVKIASNFIGSGISRNIIIGKLFRSLPLVLKSQDLSIECFARTCDWEERYVHYCVPPRDSLPTEGTDSTTLDYRPIGQIQKNKFKHNYNQIADFVLLVRDKTLYTSTMEYSCHGTGVENLKTVMKNLEIANVMQFNPFLSENDQCGFASRQQWLQIYVNAEKLTFIMYNWSAEKSSIITDTIAGLTQWQNARMQLTREIVLQKMGLVHVFNRTEEPKSIRGYAQSYRTKDAKCSPMELLSNGMWCNPDILISSSDPPPNFLEMFKDFEDVLRPRELLKPWVPIQLLLGSSIYTDTALRSYREVTRKGIADPTQIQGSQLLEIRNELRKFLIKRDKLLDMHKRWVTAQSNHSENIEQELSRTQLNQLISQAQLVHLVDSPILFNPTWRKTMGQVRRPAAGKELRMFNKLAGRGTTPIPPVQQESQAWHEPIQCLLLKKYSQYLRTVGMRKISVQHSRERNISTRSAVSMNYSEKAEEQWLGRATQQGLIVVHLSFIKPYFVLRIYALELVSLFRMIPTFDYKEGKKKFSHDCARIAMMTHVHSFCYDFHLYLLGLHCESNVSSLLGKRYQLDAFLADFIKYYSEPPPYARTRVHQVDVRKGGINKPLTPKDLFDHITKYDRKYNFEVLASENRVKAESSAKQNQNQPNNEMTTNYYWVYRATQDSDDDDEKGTVEVHGADLKLIVPIFFISSIKANDSRGTMPEFELECYMIFYTDCEMSPRPYVKSECISYHRHESASSSSSSSASPRKRAMSHVEASSVHQHQQHQTRFSVERVEETEGVCVVREPISPPIPAGLIDRSNSFDRSENIDFHYKIQTKSSRYRHTEEHSLWAEQVTHIYYATEQKVEIDKAVLSHARDMKNNLHVIINKAAKHCKRELLWRKLRQGIGGGSTSSATTSLTSTFATNNQSELSASKRKDDSLTNQFISYSELEELLSIVRKQTFDEVVFGEEIENVLTLLQKPEDLKDVLTWYIQLIKLFMTRYGFGQDREQRNFICRHFKSLSDQDESQYLILMSPDFEESALVMKLEYVVGKHPIATFFFIFRDFQHLLSTTPLPYQELLAPMCTEFMNTVAFHLWSYLL